MDYVCPEHHNLESWGDLNPSHNVFTLMQPTISPLFNTRQFEESLLNWMDKSDYHAYLSDFWKNREVNWENFSPNFFAIGFPDDFKEISSTTCFNFDAVNISEALICII